MNTMHVKLEIKDASLRHEVEKIISAVSGLQILRPDDSRRADLLIYELGTDVDNDFQLIESLLNVNMAQEVFLTSKNASSDVLMRAISIGAKEFIPYPFQAEQVTTALEKFKKRNEGSKPQETLKFGRIIPIVGSKGGVGTTTIAVNLAVELAEPNRNKTVALVDMNFLFGEVPLFLEIKPKYHLGEISKHISRLDPTFLMDILSKHHSGVYILPADSYFRDIEKTTPKIMERVLTLLKRMFDFVIIDAGNSIGDNSLKVFELSDMVLGISILSLPCLANTNRLLSTFQSLGYPSKDRIKVIVNRYVKQSDLSLEDAVDAIKKDIFWTIPNDYKTTMTAINQGNPIATVAPTSAVSRSIKSLADEIIGKEETTKEKPIRKFFSWGKST